MATQFPAAEQPRRSFAHALGLALATSAAIGGTAGLCIAWRRDLPPSVMADYGQIGAILGGVVGTFLLAVYWVVLIAVGCLRRSETVRSLRESRVQLLQTLLLIAIVVLLLGLYFVRAGN